MNPLRGMRLATITLLFGACSSIFGPDWEETIGLVDGSMLAQGTVFQVDTVVAVGTSGRIAIVTGGSGSCTRFGRTEVVRSGPQRRQVDVTPYNEDLRTENACTADFRFIRHEVSVNYGEPGTYSVRVRVRILAGAEHIASWNVRVQ